MSRRTKLPPLTAAQQAMVTDNIRLARWYTKRARQPGECRHEVYQACLEGLVRAVQGYDAERGVRFGYYASIWMRSKVQRMREFRRRSSLVFPQRYDKPDGPKVLFGGLTGTLADRRDRRHDQDGFEAIIKVVDPRMRQMLRMRFVDGKHWLEIGQELGLSKQRVGQLMTKAFVRLTEEARRLRSREANTELATLIHRGMAS
jgi:RNA polymerase sigma factor (sigma-70 family)